MNDYYGNFPENDYRYYLQHGTKGKHWEWPKEVVKYIGKKITDSGAVRYIYDTAGKVKKAVSDYKANKAYRKTGEYKKKEEKAKKQQERYLERSGAKKYGSESTVLKEGKKVRNVISLLRPIEKYLRSRKVARNIKKVDKQREKEAKNLIKAGRRLRARQLFYKYIGTPIDNLLKYGKRKKAAESVASKIQEESAKYAKTLEKRREEEKKRREREKREREEAMRKANAQRNARANYYNKKSKKARAKRFTDYWLDVFLGERKSDEKNKISSYVEANPEKNPRR